MTLIDNPQTNLVERKDFSVAAWEATPRPVAKRNLLAVESGRADDRR